MNPTLEFPGGWYVDALPSGERAVLFPLAKAVGTHLGPLTPPDRTLPLYTCITATPVFQIAGQAWDVPGTTRYRDGQWTLDPRIAHGNSGCIFDNAGELRIIEPAADQTSQGIRYVAPDNRLVLGDETLLRDGVSAWTDLSEAQDGSFLIGQGHDAGGIVVRLDGVLRLVHAGESYEPRAHRVGERVSLAFYDVQPDGLTAYIYDVTVDELRALTPIGDSVVRAPKISVISYDNGLRAGGPWHVEFANAGDGTRFLVTKDARDRLWVEARNATGSDRTGIIRQLTIEGPDHPKPEPQPMPTLGRFWYQSNFASDLLRVFDQLPQAGAFVLPIQTVLTDQPGGQVGDNTYPNLAAAGAFAKLKAAGVPLAFEAGALKEFDCDGVQSRAQIETAVRRVEEAGGTVGAFSMDEPLTGNTITNAVGKACDLSPAACADVTAKYILQVRSFGCRCGWLEAWPRIPFDQLKAFLPLLNERGALPDYLHVDINYHEVTKKQNVPAFVHAMQEECAKYGVIFGAFINSTEDPINADQAHHENLIALANKMHAIVPDLAHVHVAAWARRVKDGPQSVPNNLGQFGLLETFAAVRGLFAPSVPIEPPVQEIDGMDYTVVDYIIRAKSLQASAADGKVVAILPGDRVGSVQPDGHFEARPAGTDAAYEQALVRDMFLLYEPIPGKRYAAAYRLDS